MKFFRPSVLNKVNDSDLNLCHCDFDRKLDDKTLIMVEYY